jgi:DNA-binding MarR family transcriptional regulator
MAKRSKVLDALRGGRELTTVQLRDEIGGSIGALYCELDELEAAGLVVITPTPATAERGWRPGKKVRLAP